MTLSHNSGIIRELYTQQSSSSRTFNRVPIKGKSSSSTTIQGTLHGSCQYDGHCPMGSTCAVSPSSSPSLGVCEPIAVQGPQQQQQQNSSPASENACVEACRAELELDEHFYQEEWPVMEWSESVSSKGRPLGCVIGYHREPQGSRWKEREKQTNPPLLEEWMAQRFRHVIRVDPYDTKNLDDNRWVSYCYSPCQWDADCATQNDVENIPGFICEGGACQRNPSYWESDTTQVDEHEMVIVTGASMSYWGGLQNLAASARFWAPNYKMVVYNLGGLTPLQQNQIRSWKNVLSLEWEDGVPASYPRHVSVGKVYAWKPIIINETLTKYKSIFWLDAGSTLAGPITPAEEIIQRTGMFLVKGQDLNMRLSHEKSYEWFNTTKEKLQTGPHFSGNTQAFLYPSRYYDAVIAPNARCALDANCIAPEGCGLNNHRYDQTTISILSYHPKVRAPHYTEYLAAERGQLQKDLKQPSTKFVWTSRQHNNFYLGLRGT